METPSDKRSFAMCFLAATVGIFGYALFENEYGGGLRFGIPVAVLAVLLFVDWFLETS